MFNPQLTTGERFLKWTLVWTMCVLTGMIIYSAVFSWNKRVVVKEVIKEVPVEKIVEVEKKMLFDDLATGDSMTMDGAAVCISGIDRKNYLYAKESKDYYRVIYIRPDGQCR